MYKKTDRVTLTGTQMNYLLSLAGNNSLECEIQAELVINERIYLQKIVALTAEIKRLQHTLKQSLRDSLNNTANITIMERKIEKLYVALLAESSKNYRRMEL